MALFNFSSVFDTNAVQDVTQKEHALDVN